MSNTKKLIIMVVILLVMSAIFNFLVRGSIRSAFTLPWASKDVSKTYEVKDSFKEIDVETDVSDITIIPIKNGKARVSRQGSSSLTFHLQTSGNKLTISDKDERLWFLRFGTNIGKTGLTLYLPEKDYQSLKVRTATGSVNVQSGFHCEDAELKSDTGSVTVSSAKFSDDLEVKTSTGRVSLSGIRADDLSVKTATGSIKLSDVIVSEGMEVKSDTGSVELVKCDGAKIKIKTDTGRISGTLLTGKAFDVKSDTGRVNIPDSVSFGGTCEIKSDTGSITIEIAGQ